MELGTRAELSSADTAPQRLDTPSPALVFLLVALALVIVAGLLSYAGNACLVETFCGRIVGVDVSQGRIDSQVPAPQDAFAIEQSFPSAHNGLREIELILIRYGGQQAFGTLSLQLWNDRDEMLFEDVVNSGQLSHNQTYVFQFPTQADSAGRIYRLRLAGNSENHVSAWGYSLNEVAGGELSLQPLAGAGSLPPFEAQVLRFVTRYELTTPDALLALASGWIGQARLLISLALLLLMPGGLLLLLFGGQRWDPGAWWGVALALGLSFWPIVWLWLGLTSFAWSGLWLWLLVGLGWLISGLVWWRRRRVRNLPASQATRNWAHLLLLFLLVVSVSTRLLAVRDLAFPPWVDSSRHGLITAVMQQQASWPDDYEPYLPVERTPYHYGFHVISTTLSLMTGLPLSELLLYLGQFLNGLLPLTIYAAGWLVTRRRDIALLAAFLVALPFFFPGYYVTWGRLTQLSAMAVMPVLVALTWRLGRGWPHVWPVVGLLAAGAFLLHFRVFLFYVPFALLAGLVGLVLYRRWQGLVKTGIAAFLLIAPRLVQLWRETDPVQALQVTVPGFNDFPVGYYTAGWERYYVWLAGVALVVVLVGLWRRQRWALFPFVLAAWVGLLFLLLAGSPLGLPETLLVNVNSMYISLFLPLSLFLSIAVAYLADAIVRVATRKLAVRIAVPILALLAGVGLGLLALFGFRQQVGIVNEQTILAEPADIAGLAWLDANLPEDARIGVNSWRWHGSTWAAGDGGAWIVPLTGRQTTTPPIDHIYNPELFAQVRDFNEAATAIEDWSTSEAAGWLRQQGVSHLYVGAKGGFFDPAALSRNPDLTRLYAADGVSIFAVNPAPQAVMVPATEPSLPGAQAMHSTP